MKLVMVVGGGLGSSLEVELDPLYFHTQTNMNLNLRHWRANSENDVVETRSEEAPCDARR